jgi:hypothetical protein
LQTSRYAQGALRLLKLMLNAVSQVRAVTNACAASSSTRARVQRPD